MYSTYNVLVYLDKFGFRNRCEDLTSKSGFDVQTNTHLYIDILTQDDKTHKNWLMG